MTARIVLRNALALAGALLACLPSHAQLFRAYVAPDGSDANACTLAAPCRLLPAALTAVAAGGEIWMLDSANYNTATVNVTKSVTILAVPGAVGSVVAIGGNAINISGAGVAVVLRNIVIVPLPGAGATNGIFMNGGAGLTLEGCLVANLPISGVKVATNAVFRAFDTIIRDTGSRGIELSNGAAATLARVVVSQNASDGIHIDGTSPGITTADIIDSTIAGNYRGIFAVGGDAASTIRVTLANSQLNNNGIGIYAFGGTGAIAVAASGNVVANNGSGLAATGTGAKIWASGNLITGNAKGFENISTGAVIESAGNNATRNNTVDKSGTVTIVPIELP